MKFDSVNPYLIQFLIIAILNLLFQILWWVWIVSRRCYNFQFLFCITLCLEKIEFY